MKLSYFVLALASTLILAACNTQPTTTGKNGLISGAEDFKISQNTWKVAYQGSTASTADTSTAALFRAAQITKTAGYDFFVIVDSSAENAASPYAIDPEAEPPDRMGTGMINPVTQAGGAAKYTPPAAKIAAKVPRAGMTIKAYKGTKPANDPNAYSADEVLARLGGK